MYVIQAMQRFGRLQGNRIIFNLISQNILYDPNLVHSQPQCLRIWECARKLWETLRTRVARIRLFGPHSACYFIQLKLFVSFISTSSQKSCAVLVLELKKFS